MKYKLEEGPGERVDIDRKEGKRNRGRKEGGCARTKRRRRTQGHSSHWVLKTWGSLVTLIKINYNGLVKTNKTDAETIERPS